MVKSWPFKAKQLQQSTVRKIPTYHSHNANMLNATWQICTHQVRNRIPPPLHKTHNLLLSRLTWTIKIYSCTDSHLNSSALHRKCRHVATKWDKLLQWISHSAEQQLPLLEVLGQLHEHDIHLKSLSSLFCKHPWHLTNSPLLFYLKFQHIQYGGKCLSVDNWCIMRKASHNGWFNIISRAIYNLQNT